MQTPTVRHPISSRRSVHISTLVVGTKVHKKQNDGQQSKCFTRGVGACSSCRIRKAYFPRVTVGVSLLTIQYGPANKHISALLIVAGAKDRRSRRMGNTASALLGGWTLAPRVRSRKAYFLRVTEGSSLLTVQYGPTNKTLLMRATLKLLIVTPSLITNLSMGYYIGFSVALER